MIPVFARLNRLQDSRPALCDVRSPNEPGIRCNRRVGHSGSHEHVSWDPSEPSDVDVIDAWPNVLKSNRPESRNDG